MAGSLINGKHPASARRSRGGTHENPDHRGSGVHRRKLVPGTRQRARTSRRSIGLDDLSTGDPGNLSGIETDLVIGSVTDQELVQQLVDGVSMPSSIWPPARPSRDRSWIRWQVMKPMPPAHCASSRRAADDPSM